MNSEASEFTVLEIIFEVQIRDMFLSIIVSRVPPYHPWDIIWSIKDMKKLQLSNSQMEKICPQLYIILNLI